MFVIYGAGGHSRELAFQMQADGLAIAAVIDKDPSEHQNYPEADVLIAIGKPVARQNVTAKLVAAGARIGTFISSRAIVAPDAVIGPGCQIFGNAVISAGVRLGAGVLVGFNAVVSHDVEIGDYSTICPGTAIAGAVTIGQRAWFGIGATTRHGTHDRPITIGNDAVVGAGAVVVTDIEAGATVVGVPARPVA